MYRKLLTTLIVLGLVSSVSANELLNWSFELPAKDSPVASWVYEGDPMRVVKVADVDDHDTHCGDYVGRSLAGWYGHDLPDGHLFQNVPGPACDMPQVIAITGMVKRCVLDGGYANHPDWGWVTVELTVDDAVIWSQTFAADDTWHTFAYVTPVDQAVVVQDYKDVHVRWGTAPGVGTKSFDIMLLDCFVLCECSIPEPATIALLGLGGLALIRRRRR